MNNQKPQQPVFSPREIQERKYTTARMNLLFVVIVTALNVFLALIQSGVYLLFAATGPMIFADLGLSIYLESGDMTYLIIFALIAVIGTVPYLLCFLFSKKHYGWMIGALVYFALDCIMLLVFFNIVSIIVDLLFHAWVVYYLVVGVISGYKLSHMPPEPVVDENVVLDDFSYDENQYADNQAENNQENFFDDQDSH